MTIRPALNSDLPALELLLPAWAHAIAWPAWLEDAIGRGGAWLCEDDSGPLGLVVMSARLFSRPFVELLQVREDARRSGVGAALLDVVEAHAPGDRLFISTNQSNAPMQALLENRGYVRSGVVHNVDPGDPELIFVKFKLPA